FPRGQGFPRRARRALRRGSRSGDAAAGARARTEMNAAARDIDAATDARFMALALALGRRGLGNTWPNPAVGAVIVRPEPHGPVVVGRGWTQPGGRPHAEVEALARAGAGARGGAIYTTLEPCSHCGQTPPCADAIIAAGVVRVVSALDDRSEERRVGIEVVIG